METPITPNVAVSIKDNHNNGTYMLPSDDTEAQRLQLQHRLLRTIFDDRLVLAPLQLREGAEILDIGTGTGLWPLDFVSTYPNAEKTRVLCIDISARLFPQHPPPNVTFQLGDILKQDAREWENRFDFVHQRLLVLGLKYKQWDNVVNNIYTMTAPGGWTQLLEGDPISAHDSDCGPATARAVEMLNTIGNAAGLDLWCSERLPGLMEKAGFIDIQVTHREVSLGARHGDIGAMFADDIMAVFRAFKTSVLQLGGMGSVRDECEYDSLMEQMELEWNCGKTDCRVSWHVIVGRKP